MLSPTAAPTPSETPLSAPTDTPWSAPIPTARPPLEQAVVLVLDNLGLVAAGAAAALALGMALRRRHGG
jgi:hypothetical protein